MLESLNICCNYQILRFLLTILLKIEFLKSSLALTQQLGFSLVLLQIQLKLLVQLQIKLNLRDLKEDPNLTGNLKRKELGEK